MNSDNLKIAKLYARTERDRNNCELARLILTNPVLELVAGLSVLEYQARHGNIGGATNIAGQAALLGIIGVQVLAPVLPVITESTKPLLDTAIKALPALGVI